MCWSVVCLVGKVQWPKVIKVVYAPSKHACLKPPTDYVVFWKNKLEHFAWSAKKKIKLRCRGERWHLMKHSLFFFRFHLSTWIYRKLRAAFSKMSTLKSVFKNFRGPFSPNTCAGYSAKQLSVFKRSGYVRVDCQWIRGMFCML